MDATKVSELRTHAEACYVEFCAAMRDGNEPWEATERRPQVKRMRVVTAALPALLDRIEALEAEGRDLARKLDEERRFHAMTDADCVRIQGERLRAERERDAARDALTLMREARDRAEEGTER